jgi:hypothetical protein
MSKRKNADGGNFVQGLGTKEYRSFGANPENGQPLERTEGKPLRQIARSIGLRHNGHCSPKLGFGGLGYLPSVAGAEDGRPMLSLMIEALIRKTQSGKTRKLQLI